MKTPEQVKGTIRSMAAKKNLRAQEILQMFLIERVLERLANSAYKNNFILKGGLLISSMIGISERNIDVTLVFICYLFFFTLARGEALATFLMDSSSRWV